MLVCYADKNTFVTLSTHYQVHTENVWGVLYMNNCRLKNLIPKTAPLKSECLAVVYISLVYTCDDKIIRTVTHM